jgi:hypothetical protein
MASNHIVRVCEGFGSTIISVLSLNPETKAIPSDLPIPSDLSIPSDLQSGLEYGCNFVQLASSHERIQGFKILEQVINAHLQGLDLTSDRRMVHIRCLEQIFRHIIRSLDLCANEKQICLSAMNPVDEPLLFCLFKKIL